MIKFLKRIWKMFELTEGHSEAVHDILMEELNDTR
jgi:hypothetical protein